MMKLSQYRMMTICALPLLLIYTFYIVVLAGTASSQFMIPVPSDYSLPLSDDPTLSEKAEKAVNARAFEMLMNSPVEPAPTCTSNEAVQARSEKQFCRSWEMKESCWEHEPIKFATTSIPPEEKCKTLWFSGLHEGPSSHCQKDGDGGYKVQYSVALRSALRFAGAALQPVLMLGRLGMENENSTELFKFGAWAKRQGVKVITVPRLPFQDVIAEGYLNRTTKGSLPLEYQQGPFMRLDIPRLIQENDLFNLPGVCPQYVLYTDVDVVFLKGSWHEELKLLKDRIPATGPAFLSYGDEARFGDGPFNNGVMMMDVDRFEQAWPEILEFGKNADPFPDHDQAWLNRFFMQSGHRKSMVDLMPLYWNWKPYWKLEPHSYNDIRIIHAHGPKPGRGLEVLAMCDIAGFDDVYEPYHPLIMHGICCDLGKMGYRTDQLFRLFRAPFGELCDDIPTPQ